MASPLALALAALAVAAPAAHAQGGQIAFTSALEGTGRVEAVSADGSGRHVLIADAHHPSWSADGRTLAFARPDDEHFGGIWTAAADGSGQRRLTGGQGYDAEPAWGPPPPTGLLEPPAPPRIAFTRHVVSDEGGSLSVWVMASDGSGARKLSGDLLAYAPAWAPDGSRIAFTVLTLGGDELRTDIHVVDPDRGAPALLIADASSPAWSPDGRRIAFESGRDRNGESCFHECEPASEIYVADASGANQTRLTFDPADDVHPAWSPDGSAIVFSSSRFYPAAESLELHAMRADGSCVVRLTGGADPVLDPAWSPTGAATAPCEQPPLEYAGMDLQPLRSYDRLPLLWLGESFSGLVPYYVSVPEGRDVPRVVGIHYGDCMLIDGRCPDPIEVQLTSVCDTNPLRFDQLPDSRSVRRGALIERDGDAVTIYTGGLAVRLHAGGERGPGRALLRRIVAALQPVSGRTRRGRRLAPPVFPRSMVNRVRTIERTVRRHGIESARRRLKLSRSALRDRVRLARTLRRLPRPTARQRRAARCRPDPFLFSGAGARSASRSSPAGAAPRLR